MDNQLQFHLTSFIQFCFGEKASSQEIAIIIPTAPKMSHLLIPIQRP